MSMHEIALELRGAAEDLKDARAIVERRPDISSLRERLDMATRAADRAREHTTVALRLLAEHEQRVVG